MRGGSKKHPLPPQTWKALRMIRYSYTQRQISEELGISYSTTQKIFTRWYGEKNELVIESRMNV